MQTLVGTTHVITTTNAEDSQRHKTTMNRTPQQHVMTALWRTKRTQWNMAFGHRRWNWIEQWSQDSGILTTWSINHFEANTL